MKIVNKVCGVSISLFLILLISNSLAAQTNSFYVYFKQNGKRFNITEKKIELKKEPFQIYIEYTVPVDIIVSASIKEATYNQALRGKLLYQIPGLQPKEKPQSFFQNANTINLTDDEPSVWYKSDTDGEKELKNSEGRFICQRNIEKLYDVDEQMILNVKDMHYYIQMVFVYAEKDEDGELMEIGREPVKIKWVEFYDDETNLYERKKKISGKEKIRIAEQNLKQKQRLERKEKKALDKLDKMKLKKEEKDKRKLEKEKKKIEEMKTENA